MGDGYIELPLYSIYIIGAGYLILIVAIIFLLFKIYYKKRNVYKTFESGTITNNNEFSNEHIKPITKQDLERLFLPSTYKYNNLKNNENNNSEETIETIEELNESEDVKDLETTTQSKHRAIEMVTNNNPNVVALISPEQMKQVVQKVLKKAVSPITSECMNEIVIDEENIQELQGKEIKIGRPASISDIYDVVRSPKPVKVKMFSVDDSALVIKRKKSCDIVRDTYTGYEFPIVHRQTYENAHLVL